MRDDRLAPQYQLRLTRAGNLNQLAVVVELGADSSDGSACCSRLAERIKTLVGVSVQVELVAAGTIPQSQGKAKHVSTCAARRKRRFQKMPYSFTSAATTARLAAPRAERIGVPPSRPAYDVNTLTDVALRVFAERGFDGASMDDVAAEAGITKASIYHHVSGKEELLGRGLDRALEALFAVLDDDRAANGSAIERLRYIVKRVAELALALRPELTVLVRARGNSTVERRALTRRRAFDRTVTELVREAQAAGDFRTTLDAGLAVRLMFGMCNSLVEWHRPGGNLSPEIIAETVVQMVFDGAARNT